MYFLENFLVPQLKSGDVVICDNATSHKVDNVKELIESKGARLVYLPPYSPDLSPIELYWSKFKHFLKKAKARTKENLHQAISNAINTITKEDVKNWFGIAAMLSNKSGNAIPQFDIETNNKRLYD